ncbi:hypothetical protein H0H93_012674, partial [Arthromyces matolae]
MSALVDSRNPNAASPHQIPTGAGSQWRNGPSSQLVPTGPKSKPTPQNYRPGTDWEPDLNPPGWDDWYPTGPIAGDDRNHWEVAVDEHDVEGGPDVVIERRSFVTITNGLVSSALHWKGHHAVEGHFVTPPPGLIALGATASFEMERSWETGNTVFSFQFGSPMVGDNYAGASPDSGNPKVQVGNFDPSGNLY